jgi:hypothetical protein
MNEREKKGQRPRITRLSLLSIISGILSILGLFLVSVGGGVSQHFYDRTNIEWANPWSVYLTALSISALSIIIGSIGLKKIELSKGLISGKKIMRHGRFISVIAIIWACLGLWFLLTGIGPHEDRLTTVDMCRANLRNIGNSMFVYASDFDNQYPTAKEWCDLLVKYSEAKPKSFICPSSGAKEGESNYAFNKNLIGKKSTEFPPDVVVLFEAKAGWNQFGGPELMNFDNHETNGCNVLFNNNRIEFIKPEQVRELNWGNGKE